MKKGFTLAEVLITLAVIGIVAAFTIGIFLPKIHERIRSSQIATAEVKFTKAMEQMALNNAIGPYYETTQEFVDELQNYLKIAKVCGNKSLEDCFGYEKIKAGSEEFEIKDIKSGKSDFGMKEQGTNYLETVGIVTIDGTSMLLSWDKNCPILEPKVYPWSGNTNETTNCVAAVIDVNSDKSPNTLNKDVALFGANQVGSTCGMSFGDYCWDAPFAANTALTASDCNEHGTTYGITNCMATDDDYWGGAMKKCKNAGKRMVASSELAAFANYVYDTTVADNGDNTWAESSELTLNISKLESVSNVLSANYTSNGNWFNIWSATEDSENAWYRGFTASNTNYGYDYRHNPNRYAICTD